MADGSIQPGFGGAYDALARVVEEFAWLSDRALNVIAQGGASGFVKPSLAAALIEARRLTAGTSYGEVPTMTFAS